MRKVGLWSLVFFAVTALMLPATPGFAGTAGGAPGAHEPGTDIVMPVVPRPIGGYTLGAWNPYAADPLGIVNIHDQMQRYSHGTDSWEVWICDSTANGSTITFGQFWSVFADWIVPYYEGWSEGMYTPAFTAAGTVTVTSNDTNACADAAALASDGTHNGALIVTDWSFGGLGGPGTLCPYQSCGTLPTKYPANGRTVWVGKSSMLGLPSVAAHEIGHALSWPHTPSGTGSDYDNPLDLMSGNLTPGGFTEPQPYGTQAFNRYAAGWVPPGDVVIASGPVAVDLGTPDSAHDQLLVIPTATQGVFYALSARLSSPFDPIPTSWQGVEVYYVDQWCGGNPFPTTGCPSLWRHTVQFPASPGGVGHVLHVGESIIIEGTSIAVTASLGNGYRVSVDGGQPCVAGLCDIGDSQFVADIVWLKDRGITAGCNPPQNDLFCPEDHVTRAQMASLLVNFLGLPPPTSHLFTDTTGSVHRDNIESLRAAGITSGCNPPANDEYCPGDNVTRAQMASFLAAALRLPPPLQDWFADDTGLIHQANINRIADAGITLGCNPPANDMFCPGGQVTREQMAAFLHRADGL